MLLQILFLICLIICCLVGYQWLRYMKHVDMLAHLPGENQFLFPNMLQFLPSFIKPYFKNIKTEFMSDVIWWDLRKMYNSHIVKFSLSTFPLVLVSDPDFPKFFVKMGSKVFLKDGSLVRYLNDKLGSNLFTEMDETLWRRHRTLLNLAFTDKTYDYVCDCVVEEMKLFDAAIEKNPIRNAGDVMAAITMDVIGKTGFGYEFNNLEMIDNPKSVVKDCRQFLSQFIYFDGLPRSFHRIPFGIIGKMNRTVDTILEIISQILNARELSTASEKPKDILQLLLDSTEQQDEQTKQTYSRLTHQELVSNCFTFMIAGHDTTAWALTFTLYLLASHPDIQHELQHRIDKLLPNQQEPRFADIDDLRFVENVFKESLRIYPIAPGIPRVVTQDITFKETLIPKDAIIIVSTGPMQYDSDHWEDAKSFKPERWEDPKVIAKLKENPYLYAPFGVGHRSCIGKRFSTIESVIVLTMILQKYTVKLADPSYKMVPYSVVSTRPKEDLYIQFEKRK